MAATPSKHSKPEPASEDDDPKRKFREALDRKNAKSSSATGHKNGGTRQSRAHGPVENRREFRRKSG